MAENSFITSVGSPHCPCINPLNITKFKVPICTNNETSLPDCYPPGYGSSCTQNNMKYQHPYCIGDGKELPGFCLEDWCYVDRNTCGDSNELFFMSHMFPDELYYSYSTCGSENKYDIYGLYFMSEVIREKHLIAVVPTIDYPYMYKLNSSGAVAAWDWDAPEYLDDSIPWRGTVMYYLHDIFNMTGVASVTYTHRTNGSNLIHPESAYTAAVDDIYRGLADLGASAFWVTEQRLAKTAFTVPLIQDKIMMFEPKVSTPNESYWHSFRTILAPFSWQVWVTFLSIIFIVSYFSVCFAVNRGPHSTWYEVFNSDHYRNSNLLQKLTLSLPVYIESVMMSFTYFFANGIDYDLASSFSYKILMIGFGFVVMIFFALYISRLSSISTLEQIQANYVGSMDKALALNKRLCAPPALKTDLDMMWSNAKFVYNDVMGHYTRNVLDFYDAGKCDIIVQSIRYIKSHDYWYSEFCKRNLVATGVVVEKHISIAAKPDVAAALSSVMETAKFSGVVYEDYEKEYYVSGVCNLEAKDEGNGDNGVLELQDIVFPIVVFLFCLLVAAGLKLKEVYCSKKVRRGIQKSQTSVQDYSNSIIRGSTINKHSRFSEKVESSESFEKGKSSLQTKQSKTMMIEQNVFEEGEEKDRNAEAVTFKIMLPRTRANVEETKNLLDNFFDNMKKDI